MRVASFEQTKSRNMQFVTQLRKCSQTDVMQRVTRGFVERTGIAPKESAAEESHARTQRGDIWRGQHQPSARPQHSASLSEKRKMVLQMLDAFRGNDGIKGVIRPRPRAIEIHSCEAIAQNACGIRFDIPSDYGESFFPERDGQRRSVTARCVQHMRSAREAQRLHAFEDRALNHRKFGRHARAL